MTQAIRDNNNVTTMQGVLSTDGVTPTNVKAAPSTHVVDIDDNTTGSDLSGANARRDANSVPVYMAVSNADGTTPVMLYVNGSGQLLTNSN